MSLLDVIQLVGYGTGAALTLWMGALLLKSRRSLVATERVLLFLALSIGLWHSSNLVIVLHTLLGLKQSQWTGFLRLTDTLAVVSIVVAYSLLLHLHLYLWANARNRSLTFTERARVYLSYVPAVFLLRAIPQLWSGEYAPMLVKLSQLQLLSTPAISFEFAFMLWAVYVLGFISVTDLIIARLSTDKSEKGFMQTLAAAFMLIAVLILAVHVFQLGKGTTLGAYFLTLANLGSLLPTALLAHRIYRKRFLDLMIRESLVVASFAVVILIVYLFGIRAIGSWSTERLGVHAGVVESLLILTLALVARPLRKWLEKRFHKLFEREARLYREVAARIGTHNREFHHLPELLQFIEERTARDLGLRRVRVISLNQSNEMPIVSERTNGESRVSEFSKISTRLQTLNGKPLEGGADLKELGYSIAYPLVREERFMGLMLVDAPADAMTKDMRGILEVVCSQIALAIEDHRLLEENVRLELRVEQDARFAALGQLAATVAHEVKNPLSAIKSIAQVLREDRNLHEYERDLDLIVGETDRLNGSVKQLLSFARRSSDAGEPAKLDDLLRDVIDLFQAQANKSAVELGLNCRIGHVVNGATASALRDALSNLVLNALQANPSGGRIEIDAYLENAQLIISVSDSGNGIEPQLAERIWEPFFTTRQRGTGLGLAIVRKRIEEVGGITRLVSLPGSQNTRFELHLPVTDEI